MTAAKRASGGRPSKPQVQRRLFVLDTNVLMHDPTAIFRFQEHDVYLPMVVLEELDANKKGLSEASRNVRQVSRFLDDLMRDATRDEIDVGLPLPSPRGIPSQCPSHPRGDGDERPPITPEPRGLGAPEDGPSGTEANTSPAATAASPTGAAEAPMYAVSRALG